MCLESAIITEFPLQKECDLNLIENYFHDQAVKKNKKKTNYSKQRKYGR